MTQITHGLRAILSSPSVYNLFQKIMGAHRSRLEFSRNYIKAQSGQRILDIGCGTAEILDYLPKVDYHGFDISKEYIASAKAKYGTRGDFNCSLFTPKEIDRRAKFDIVLAIGVLHHLDDNDARQMFSLAYDVLKDGGRFITIDPSYSAEQNFLSRYLVSLDRGQNVRDQAGYFKLVPELFSVINVKIKHRIWIPYTHCIIELQK